MEPVLAGLARFVAGAPDFKRYACCRYNHPAVHPAVDLGETGAGTAWELCRRSDEVKSARELTDGLHALALPGRPR